jgi:hypothetical protein
MEYFIFLLSYSAYITQQAAPFQHIMAPRFIAEQDYRLIILEIRIIPVIIGMQTLKKDELEINSSNCASTVICRRLSLILFS